VHVKILGPGCGNCHALERLTREAMTELGITADITAVTDYPAILAHGVMSTPALVIDEQVVLSGRVPSRDQIHQVLASRIS
jgi:small redox-active disulfide protein 2